MQIKLSLLFNLFIKYLQHKLLTCTRGLSHSHRFVGPQTRPTPQELESHGSSISLPTETNLYFFPPQNHCLTSHQHNKDNMASF
jgi:hypothetical protein